MPHSADLWAPELHVIRGRWYIYVAAAHPAHGNKSHRMYVLSGPFANQDPCDPAGWEMLGLIEGLPKDQWAIDGTVMNVGEEMYFVYSGWPIPNPGDGEALQELFIIKLVNPAEAVGQPVKICSPIEAWERSGASGINEGPQVLHSPDGRWFGIVYSCAGSWTKDYKMNTLRYVGGDPLNPASWRKRTRPLIQAHGNRPPWGPGHGTFVHVRNETFAIYHATDRDNEGWENRKARVQRVRWMDNGPDMGGCCGPLGDGDAFVNGPRDEGGAGHHGELNEWKGMLRSLVDRFR